jgi:two-component system, NtrC family, sensor histidine kinase PilS
VVEQGAHMRRRLRVLLALRAATVTVLLVTAGVTREGGPAGGLADPLLFLLALTCALTAAYGAGLGLLARRPRLVDAHLAGDAVLASAFVVATGGIQGFFAPLYVLPVIAASLLRGRRGGLTIATLSAALYGAIVAAQYALLPLPLSLALDSGRGVLPPVREALVSVGVNVLGFVTVGLLTGYLVERVRQADRQLERATTEIKDLQAFSQHVIDSLTGGLLTSDHGGRVLTVNRAAESITGHTADECRGRRVWEVLQLPAAFCGRIDHAVERGAGHRVEFVYTRPSGARIDVGMTAAPLVTATGRAGFIFTFRDLTETKQVEREAQMQKRLAAVGEMAAGIAHEIRNPLASMSGSIQVLQQELTLTAEQAQLMEIVLRESERLNDTIQNFLAYARPPGRGHCLVDLATLLAETAVLLRNLPELRGGSHAVTVVGDGPAWVEADDAQMRQVAWNLATNGVRAMPLGGTLTLSTEVRPVSSGSVVVVAVRDEGVGMSDEELDEIFHPFRSGFSKGIGLGLPIVHRIVSDYEGEIAVTSEPGRGTTVTVTLPGAVTAGGALNPLAAHHHAA